MWNGVAAAGVIVCKGWFPFIFLSWRYDWLAMGFLFRFFDEEHIYTTMDGRRLEKTVNDGCCYGLTWETDFSFGIRKRLDKCMNMRKSYSPSISRYLQYCYSEPPLVAIDIDCAVGMKWVMTFYWKVLLAVPRG
jgi:hypothetical protein